MLFLSWDQAVDLAEAHDERYRGSSISLSTPGCAGASWSGSGGLDWR